MVERRSKPRRPVPWTSCRIPRRETSARKLVHPEPRAALLHPLRAEDGVDDRADSSADEHRSMVSGGDEGAGRVSSDELLESPTKPAPKDFDNGASRDSDYASVYADFDDPATKQSNGATPTFSSPISGKVMPRLRACARCSVCEARLQTRRHLRRRVRSIDAVLLFNLRRALLFTDGKPRLTEDEIRLTDRPKVIIIGGGPNRIGQGIEFDYCCVQAAFAMKELGIESVMVNSNPETVSTDYDTSDLLFFEPLTHEDILNICERLNGAPFSGDVEDEQGSGERRHRPVRWSNPPEPRPRTSRSRRPHHRHNRRFPRRRRRSRAIPRPPQEAGIEATRTTASPATSKKPARSPATSAIPSSSAPASCSAVARWRSSRMNSSSTTT